VVDAEGVAFVLRRRGYPVRCVGAGEAVEAARADRPRVVVIGLDSSAAAEEGWLAAARIRDHARRTRIIVVGPEGRIVRGRAAALGYGVLSTAAAAGRILAEVARQTRTRGAGPSRSDG
jgi:ActR/RegA family two-component response regulator